MKHYSLCNKATGLFTGKRWSIPDSRELNLELVPEGFEAVPGIHDHLSRRRDSETGEVVDWQPPRPSDDHDWDTTERRWKVRQSILERAQRRANAVERIAELERRQHRRVRELLAASDPTLRQLDEEIATLRAEIRGDGTETTAP